MAQRNALLLVALLAAGTTTVRSAEEPPVLELTLEQAVERTLENNVDIAVERFSPQSAQQDVREALSIYDPVFGSTLAQTSRTQPAQSSFQGADKVDTDATTFNFDVRQVLPSGADVDLTFNNQRSETNSAFQIYNPRFDSTFEASVTQPLLRNFRIDNRRYQIVVAKKNRQISDVQFEQTVINTVANVKQLYYDLIYAMDNLGAQQKNLALARKLLGENQIKVKVGTMAPLDVVSAEAEVASREEGVIVAEAAVAQAQDDLKRALFPKHEEATWALRIVPTDRPTAEEKEIDVAAAITTALEKRTDIVAARKNLEILEARLSLAHNGLLPAVNLVASYGTIGAGGTQQLRDEGPFGPVTGTIPGGYGDATSAVFGRDFPTWTIGANVSYPLFNRAARAGKARATIVLNQARTSLRRLELQIAAEVRAAARAVETNFKRVESTAAATKLAARRLDAEEKKFAAGMSTNYQVTQAQRDLAEAEVAELRAIADYRKGLITFDRVQHSAGGSVSFAGSASSGS